jgi:glycosyltransferase involved in cell wall biosynthesis
VARSRKLELVLAGAVTDKGYVRRLKDEAARSGIGEAVQFRGLLGEQELLEELGRAAVLVLPSYQETAPMVVVEAMAAGVPVIATHVGGTGYLVEDGRTGFLVPPGDIDALSDKLLTLLSDASLRRAFGAAAKTRATETYHADNVARRTVDAYRQVLRASGGP